jgi:hypothetical protein
VALLLSTACITGSSVKTSDDRTPNPYLAAAINLTGFALIPGIRLEPGTVVQGPDQHRAQWRLNRRN